MTGHKKRFCSFKSWMRITNIIKNTESVRNVASENTLPDVSVVKFVLRRTRRVVGDTEIRKAKNSATRDWLPRKYITEKYVAVEKITENASGAESPYRLIVRVSAQIAELRTKRIMNAVKAIFHVLNGLHMAFVTVVERIQL